MLFPQQENIPEGHRAAETRDLKPADQYLRRAGWAIHARPAAGPAVWAKGGKLLPEAEALLEALSGDALKG